MLVHIRDISSEQLKTVFAIDNKRLEKENHKNNSAFLFIVHTFEREHPGIMQISACLKENNFPVYICRADEPEAKKMLKNLCGKHNTVVAGYSVPSVLFRSCLELNKKLKKQFDFVSVFGGPHPTYYPEIIKKDSIDVICRGEGVYPALDLMEALEKGRRYDNIDNLWVKSGNKVTKNSLRPLVKDLDSLAFADYSLFRDGLSGTNPQNMIMVLSRGCSFGCSYCFSHAFNRLYRDDNIYARRTVGSVIAEIKGCMNNYDIGFISFCDSIFTLDKTWLEEFSRAYRREIGLPFYCNVHPECVDADRARLLSEAGCSVAGMGIESGNEKVRFDILNRPVTDTRLKESAATLKKHGIKIASGNIIAIPQTDIEDDLKTLKLNIECGVDFPEIFIMSLHQGTDIYEKYCCNDQESLPKPTVSSLGVFYASTKSFGSDKEKRMIVNLQNLFVVIVVFPFLYPFTRFLVGLPLSRFYSFLFSIFESYKTFTYKNSYRNLLKRALIHLSILKNRFKLYENLNSYE